MLRTSHFHDFRKLIKIVKLNRPTCEFLEFADYRNFICREYQHLENATK